MKTSVSRNSLGSESSACRYLMQHIERTGYHCPRCSKNKVYLLADRRRRCAQCRYTFHELTGRWINECRLSCGAWLQLLSLFEDDVPVLEMEARLHLSHGAVYHAVTVVRLAILAHADDGDRLLEDILVPQLVCYETPAQAAADSYDSPVFGISESGPQLAVRVLPALTPCTVLALPIKKVRRGNVVHTARFSDHDTLAFAARFDALCAKPFHFARSPVYIDGREGFWRFASARLAKHFGITAERFPLYLKEAEFRYRHRKSELRSVLAQYLCDFIPNKGGRVLHPLRRHTRKARVTKQAIRAVT